MKERDRLVEQTLAFVQGVAAQRPIRVTATEPDSADASMVGLAAQAIPTARPDTDPAAAETDALISLMTLSSSDEPARQTAVPALPEGVKARLPVRATVTAAQPAAKTRKPPDMALPERDVIALRVARFRASQQRLIRERDDNYAQMQAKIRATLGNDPSP